MEVPEGTKMSGFMPAINVISFGDYVLTLIVQKRLRN